MPPPKTIEAMSIDELSSITRDHRTPPTLVTGLTATAQPWTPESVVERVDDTVVPVTQIVDGDYMGAEQTSMSVREYYSQITETLATGPMPYLAELSYDEHFPELAADLIDPPQLAGERFLQRVMYLGRLVNSQAHFHPSGSAMLFCLHGAKIVRLYAPDQTDRMYKVARRNFTEVQVSSLGENTYEYDTDRFPRFADAEYLEVEVRAGDVLFIPIYWWHSIQNLGDVSLTAVYFWTQTWRDGWRLLAPKQPPPPGMRADYARDVLSRTRHHPRDVARTLLGRGRA